MRFQRPSFPTSEAVEHYFAPARERSWYSNGGPCLEEFSRRLGERSGSAVLPLANATLALMLAVAALTEGRGGSRILLPSFTFPAVIEAVLWNGLAPVFVDISAPHLHLDPACLTAALDHFGPDVALVIAGSSFGTPPPPDVRSSWERSCNAAGVPLLIDSAAGFPALAADGVPIGAQGSAEVVSFHITKPFGIGEGGALFSRDAGVIERARSLANFGFDEKRSVVHLRGTNAKLDELHAAVGLAVFDEVDRRVDQRRSCASSMLEALGPDYEPQFGHENGTYQFLSVLAPSPRIRADVLRRASGRVELRTYYDPLHRFPAFAGMERFGHLTTTEDVARRVLSLPMFDSMNETELALICGVVREP